MRVYRRRYH